MFSSLYPIKCNGNKNIFSLHKILWFISNGLTFSPINYKIKIKARYVKSNRKALIACTRQCMKNRFRLFNKIDTFREVPKELDYVRVR